MSALKNTLTALMVAAIVSSACSTETTKPAPVGVEPPDAAPIRRDATVQLDVAPAADTATPPRADSGPADSGSVDMGPMADGPVVPPPDVRPADTAVVPPADADARAIEMKAITAFPKLDAGDVPYAREQNRDALTINAPGATSGTAAAEGVFPGPAGRYRVVITTLTEFDGESTYQLVLNGAFVASERNPAAPDNFNTYEMFIGVIDVPAKAVVQVRSTLDTNNKEAGSASLGRWRAITFTPAD